MKNNKGFTLIELLAVILILGIIALIAVPTINKMLDDIKLKAFESTINNLTKAVEEKCNTELIKNKDITNNYTIIDGKSIPNINIKGDIPNGDIKVNSDCDTKYYLSNNSYVSNKKTFDDKSSVEKCTDKCEQYYEPLLNGAKPLIDDGLIPVTIQNNGTVNIADLYSEWYSYEDKKWANAVLVTDSSKESYQEAPSGTKINQDDILAYFVWIPRYKYRISTSGTNEPSTIDIVFENIEDPKSTGNAITQYLTHPGFTFGDQELNGIWFGKFETTGSATEPSILPNVLSLRSQILSDQFKTARLFNNYGLNGDAHMAKNTEWATAVYLSHSDYGTRKQIRINNTTKTGCGASEENGEESTTCQIQYGNNIQEYPQSTTNNITGIFDLSGGASEETMSNYNNIIADAGFSKMPEKKYYDLYETTNYLNACNGKPCLGHALYETKNWYNDYLSLIKESCPWTDRGGHYFIKESAGAYSSGFTSGTISFHFSFRVIIS